LSQGEKKIEMNDENRKELLAVFETHDSLEQRRFVLELMDATGCIKCMGLGWIWRLIAATPEEIKKASDAARGGGLTNKKK